MYCAHKFILNNVYNIETPDVRNRTIFKFQIKADMLLINYNILLFLFKGSINYTYDRKIRHHSGSR
jgi:hypothetical protein